MFTVNKVPGFAAQMRRDSSSRSIPRHSSTNGKSSEGSPNGRSRENGIRSREHSPKMPRPRSEEIPLEDMRNRKASLGKTTICLPAGIQEIIDIAVSSAPPTPESSSSLSRKSSEETSFTSPQNQAEPKPRRKGQVETV